MDDRPYVPTEAQIEAVLSRYSPRQIAVAYLRASRRARDAELYGAMMESVAGLATSVMSGDVGAAERHVDKAVKAARTHKEATE